MDHRFIIQFNGWAKPRSISLSTLDDKTHTDLPVDIFCNSSNPSLQIISSADTPANSCAKGVMKSFGKLNP